MCSSDLGRGVPRSAVHVRRRRRRGRRCRAPACGGAAHPASTRGRGADVTTLLADGASDAGTALGIYPGDLESDGSVDLLALRSNAEDEDYLYRGQGDGSFAVDATMLPKSARYGLGFDARWFDRDDDGDLDLYVANDMGPTYGPNVLLDNDGGTLVDASSSCDCALNVSAMGISAGDIDGDGRIDLYISESAGTGLLYQLEDGTFVDGTAAGGLVIPEGIDMGWAAPLFDIDNDGDLDLLEARGDLWADPERTWVIHDDNPELFLQQDGIFTQATTDYGFDHPGSWRGVVPFEANGDGVPDLLVTDVVARPLLLESNVCTEETWLEVAAPLHARVDVTAGGRTQVGWVSRQVAMGPSGPPVVHFGLGDANDGRGSRGHHARRGGPPRRGSVRASTSGGPARLRIQRRRRATAAIPSRIPAPMPTFPPASQPQPPDISTESLPTLPGSSEGSPLSTGSSSGTISSAVQA